MKRRRKRGSGGRQRISKKTARALQEYLLSDIPVLRCVAPLLSVLDEPDYPPEARVGIRASCCAVDFAGTSAIVTAAHAVRGLTKENVRVPWSTEGTLRTLNVHTLVGTESDHDPDIAVGVLQRSARFDMQSIVPFGVGSPGLMQPYANAGDVFLALGYPHDLSGIEYDEGDGDHLVRLGAQRLAGHYVAPSGTNLPGMHQLRFVEPDKVVRPTGMSGGGVFRIVINDPSGTDFHAAFVGIVTNGSKQMMHFVELKTVFERLQQFLGSLRPSGGP